MSEIDNKGSNQDPTAMGENNNQYQQDVMNHQNNEQNHKEKVNQNHQKEKQDINLRSNNDEKLKNSNTKKKEDNSDKGSDEDDEDEIKSIHLKAPEDKGCIGKFGISKEKLMAIAYACQDRNFSEDVDLLESAEGVEVLEKHLHTNFKDGLNEDAQDFLERKEAFGDNQKESVPLKTFFELFVEALDDFTVKLLIVAAAAALILEMALASPGDRSIAWIDGFGIFVAVLIVGFVTSINNYQKERQFAKLNSVSDESKIVTVIRSGKPSNIHMSLVQVGDIVVLNEGMEIPADGIILESSELITDESAMTGETDPIKKQVLKDCIQIRNQIINSGEKNTSSRHEVPSVVIMSGTRVLQGEGKMVVVVVGDYSCAGKISALLRTQELAATPLQQKLEAIARDIGFFGLYSAILIYVVLVIRFAIEAGIQGSSFDPKDLLDLLHYLILAITVVAVAIPEGLPLSVTISLAFSVKKMLRDQNLVKQLQACETMGGANCICSDKTGTLTKNEMTLTDWWNDEHKSFEREAQFNLRQEQNMSEYSEQIFKEQIAINSAALLRPSQKGSKTEIAALKLLEQAGYNYEDIRNQCQVEHKFPFNSKRKRMSVIVKVKTINGGTTRRIYVKGASELVLASCTKWHKKQDDQILPIDEKTKQKMLDSIKNMADKALRTLVCAYKDIPDNADITTKNEQGVFSIETSDLTLHAIFGIYDVVRPEVPGAIEKCKIAQIKVRMVTGDNKDTARAIAKECGILTSADDSNPYSVLEGPDFIQKIGGVVCKKHKTVTCDCARDKKTAAKNGVDLRVDTILNGDVFDKIVPHLNVLSRSRPEDKYALVTGLIERGNVVAVTGDGTNDAPALKKADIGFAMGIAGTEVAKEAADIVILDDNFKSILAAVLWGRNIYECIKKFLQFQLTVNVVAVSITLIGAAVIKQEVLSPIQMLWVNLIMDTFASLALATEPPGEHLLKMKPHDRDEYIISRKMFKHIISQSIFQLIIMLIFIFAGPDFLPEYSDDFDHRFYGDTNNPYFSTGEFWRTKYSNPQRTKLVQGRLMDLNGVDKMYQSVYDEYKVPSRHFTCIFNVFVMMQVFNFLNSRKIHDEFNVFHGIEKNPLFFLIILIILFFQVILITFAGIAFNCYSYYGLTVQQWFICIAFGVLGNFVSVIVKFIPDTIFPAIGKKQVDPIQTESKILALKGNRGESGLQRKFSSLNVAHNKNHGNGSIKVN
ncbi:hypothetical protein ABPG72_010676 [Tetrahymena utriculariae]